MRYVWIVVIILITSLYTYPQGMYRGGDDDDDNKKYKNDDDDDNKGKGKGKGDDDDRGGDDDDDDRGGDDDWSSNQNYMEVNTNRSLSFTCSKPEHLENKQTLNNAISLKFKTKNSNCTVYAKLSQLNKPSSASLSDVKLYLDWTSDNSKNAASLLRDPVLLTQTDQRLFIQYRSSQTFHFNYDLELGPVGYEAPAGQYSYTILFTMTQP